MALLQPNSLLAIGMGLALATACASVPTAPGLAETNPGPGGWGLVLGADASPQAAAAEATRASQALGVRAQVYRCGNWFRTVAVVATKQQALDLLSRAQTRSPYNPYLVELARWCPGKTLAP